MIAQKYHKNPFLIYTRRWSIETMFSKFKTIGFNLESTHIINRTRLASLMQLVAITYVCCCKLGHFINKLKPIKLKKFKSADKSIEERPQFSIFKLGFYLLKNYSNNHLFDGAAMAKLLHEILDSDTDKLKLNKRSAAYNLLTNF